MFALAGCGAEPLRAPLDAAISSPRADAGVPALGGDAAAPGTIHDASAAGAPVRLARTTRLTDADLSTAVVLAADVDGIYWATADNLLWMLPTGDRVPRQLPTAVGAGAPYRPSYGSVLLASGPDLFWTSWEAGARGFGGWLLRRTRKTGGDTVVADLFADGPSAPVTVDSQYVYWSQVLSPEEGGAAIQALPRDADAGTAPVTLVTVPTLQEAASLAVDEQFLYWTPFDAIGATVYYATIWRASRTALFAGTDGGALFVNLAGESLAPCRGELYFNYSASLWRSAVGRADVNGQVVVDLPLPAGALAFLGDWVVSWTVDDGTAPPDAAPANHAIYAAPLGESASGGGGVQIAASVALAPVAGVPGLIFVDAAGHLLAISEADLAAAVTGGRP
jgi:hypothetical protein